MKKFSAILIAAVITALSLCCVSFAAGKGKIEVESKECKPGEIIEVAINVSNNPGIVAIKFSVEYDKNVLKLVGSENGDVFNSSAATFSKSVNNYPYTMLWTEALSRKNITVNGTLAVLKFEVVATESCTSYIKVNLDKNSTFDVNLNDVNFDVSDGKIEVKAEQLSESFFEKIISFFDKIKDFFKRIVYFIKNLFE